MPSTCEKIPLKSTKELGQSSHIQTFQIASLRAFSFSFFDFILRVKPNCKRAEIALNTSQCTSLKYDIFLAPSITRFSGWWAGGQPVPRHDHHHPFPRPGPARRTGTPSTNVAAAAAAGHLLARNRNRFVFEWSRPRHATPPGPVGNAGVCYLHPLPSPSSPASSTSPLCSSVADRNPFSTRIWRSDLKPRLSTHPYRRARRVRVCKPRGAERGGARSRARRREEGGKG